MSVFITGQAISGDQAIVALEHVVSVVESTPDEGGEPTIMIRLRDHTHLELSMSIDTFWNLIPGETTRVRSLHAGPGKRK